MSKGSGQSATSVQGLPLHLRQSLCEGHGAPAAAPPLWPQDPADEEPLNGLYFCSRNLMHVFTTALLDFWTMTRSNTSALYSVHAKSWQRLCGAFDHPVFSFQHPHCSLFTLSTNFLASYNSVLIRATYTKMELMLQIIKVRDSVQGFSSA